MDKQSSVRGFGPGYVVVTYPEQFRDGDTIIINGIRFWVETVDLGLGSTAYDPKVLPTGVLWLAIPPFGINMDAEITIDPRSRAQGEG